MYMIFNLIASAAVINVVLGVLALTKGRSRLNLSFFFISLLLAVWNIFLILWAAGNLEVFSRLNFIVISFIPIAGMFFVLSLFRIEKGTISFAPYIMLVFALGLAGYAIGTFYSAELLSWYDSKWCKIIIFVYELSALFIVLGSLVYYYGRIRFKQEKIKVRYVIAAFLILYAGGMLDLAVSAGLFHFPVKYMGNICNVVYAGIIFYAIFKMRLFNLEVIFKNFIAYTFTALVAGAVYVMLAIFLANEIKALAAVYFMLTLLLVYYAKRIHDYVLLFVENLGEITGVEEARRACQRITAAQADEDEKIPASLLLFQKHLDMNAAVFVKGGDYYMLSWETAGSVFKKLIEGSAMPLNIIIRYETANKRELELLNRFDADLIMPLVYSGEIIGVLAGKKQTADISFTQDEVDLILDMASNIAVYMKAKVMKRQQAEDENMKRIGMMAKQMAHEIKNPLAALWGAAQLIEGKSDADKENLVIIKEEMQRLTNILDTWQDFSRELKMDRQNMDVEGLIAEVLKLIYLQKHKAEVLFEKPREKISVNVDTEKIKQVLLNVMLNAIDASELRDAPVIGISVIKKKRYADIKIKDNGLGIKKEDLLKVKEPMFTSKPKGSGLGLAISERIMKAHGGALLLDSDGESFTEVTLSIPME